jgi:hypothetical protein
MNNQTTSLPLFYERPAALNYARHADKKLASRRHFRFAQAANALPISASEFVYACRRYPIVFSAGENPAPLMLTGLEPGSNLFIGDDGNWSAGDYVPAYVRRYPFILMESDDAERFFLCVDEASDMVTEEEGEPFFEGSEQSAATQNAASFCQAYQRDHALALIFAREMLEHGLFADQEARVKVGKEERRLTGFRAIDQTKLSELDNEVIVDWHRRGILALIAHHAASMHAWADLALKAPFASSSAH